MATIKSFTSLEQSKKLSEILSLDSADMHYISFRHKDDTIEWIPQLGTPSKYDIPCWSLSALLNVLPEYNLQRTDWSDKTEYKIVVTLDDENFASKNYDNPVDACYEMIIKLNELKML